MSTTPTTTTPVQSVEVRYDIETRWSNGGNATSRGWENLEDAKATRAQIATVVANMNPPFNSGEVVIVKRTVTTTVEDVTL